MKTKLIILAVVSIFFVSCSGKKYIQRTTPGETLVSFLDFHPYLSKGFVFSTGEINQNYIPLGILYHTTKPDIVNSYRPFGSMNEFTNREGILTEGDQDYILIGSHPKQKSNVNDLLQKVYELSISKGANGMINLKYNILKDETIEMSGTLVKIEK